MFGLFASLSPRRRRVAPGFGIAKSVLESLEDRVLLSGAGADNTVVDDLVVDHDHDHGEEDHYPYIEDFSDVAPEFLTSEMLFPAETTFQLHSKPDSNFTIYLDFDGFVTNGVWNTNPNDPQLTHLGYDTDGDLTSFSQQELSNIQRIWEMVAEDFAPFDINVTTEEPPVSDLINSGAGDTRWGSRAVMTINNNGACTGCGGVALVGSFDAGFDDPAYVFNGTRSNGGIFALAETISHEVGHNLGLGHDGEGSLTYYSGHGTGPEGWGPIMGAPFSKTTTHWSDGNYFNSTNNQDDLTVITTTNGLGYRQDDYGNTRGAATAMVPVNGTQLDFDGVIEQNSDVDYIRFDAGNGSVSFNITTFSERPNLNVFAALYDSSGTLVTFVNPKNDPGAILTASVTTGTYYLRIEGVGSDDVYNSTSDAVVAPTPQPYNQNPPLGFSDYGSLGFYFVTGSVPAATADYGDAPDSYSTTDAAGGPSHLGTGPILGAVRDTESDANPGPNANGDDNSGIDDEDGVQFLNIIVPGGTAKIRVTSVTGGILDGWIDFDGSGTFDPTEQVILDFDLPVGVTDFDIPVPQTAAIGTTYARFRIAATAFDVDSPVGSVNNGEVEDYKITVKPRQVINEVLFNTPGDNTGKEYIELRSAPGTLIDNGTYLVVVEGDGNGGTIDMVYNLSGLQYGANGYLVLLQKDSPYASLVDPDSTVVTSTQVGWRDFGARVFINGFSENNLENGSQTYFLINAPARPLLGGDIDADNNGTPDGSIYGVWDILDSVGFIDSNVGDQAYGAINFRTNGGGLTPTGSVSVDSGAAELGYIGRNLISEGPAAAGWVGGVISGGAAPIWALSSATPNTFNGRPLDHIGSLNFDQLDFGDLPDSYNTAKVNNGASHGVGGPILGTVKDVESDGLPTANADGDDNLSSDDEDGVLIPALKEGTAGVVSVTINNVTAGAFVYGWFDWNANGSFADAGEAVIAQSVAANGAVTFNVTAPIGSFDTTNGATYARFRVSTTALAGPAGAAADGEVEDYAITVLTSATDDFGDAPDSYGTTLAANGARHTGTGPTLGTERDIERDGLASADALGDDSFKTADEDGVFILTAIAPGHTSIAEVNAPTGGVLDAWMDLNANGTFDSGEQIITNYVLTPGVNSVNFDVPTGSTVGSTFARFRIAAAAGDVTGPTGAAPNGEVEDYKLEILPIFNRPPQVSGGPFTIVENSPNDTVVGALTASDPDPGQSLTYSITRGNFGRAFKIDPVTGVISVNATEWVDYEIQNRFDLEVTVTDSGNPALSVKTTVRIDLTDVADGISLVVREGDAVGTKFGRIPTSLTDRPLDFLIVNGNTDGAFGIDAEGLIFVANSTPLDFETHPVFDLEIFVTDNLSNTEQVFVTVKVLDRNEAPMTSDETFQVLQYVPNGTVVGQVVATDPDVGQTLRYSIFRGNEDGAFAIDQNGVITVADRTKLNFDTNPIYDLVVAVSDNAEVPFTVGANVRIYVRKYVQLNNFNVGALGPNWSTTGDTVSVRSIPGANTTPQLVLEQTNSTPQVLLATLDLELRDYDDLVFQFQRTILDANTSGRVQYSNDGGMSWVTINTFDGAVNPASQRVLINLTAASQASGRPIRGRTLIRFTAETTSMGEGVAIDNIVMSGRIREATADDVLIYDETNNVFQLGFSNGTEFVFSTSPWLPGGNWEFLYGDFNNDQRLDVAGFDTVNSKWVVGLSTGAALYVKQWTSWNSSISWDNLVVGDFNGDGFDDIAAQTSTGQVWIGYSNGDRFVNRPGVNFAATNIVQLLAGDVNADGFDDIIARKDDGSLSVGKGRAANGLDLVMNAGTFGYANWSDVLMGDFNGNGRMELVARRDVGGSPTTEELKAAGQIWLGEFVNGKFTFRYGTRWSSSEVWSSVVVSDFNNDGLDDLVGGTQGGAWWGALSDGNVLVNRYFGRSVADPTHTVIGDFNLDGKNDFATFYGGTNEWIVGLGGGTRPMFSLFGSLPIVSTFGRPGGGALD
ncbi:MAG: cadherin domain-containing protein [Planctomycetaceae bacterium]|nr:cadherin domain-containing protein [Planctomycetaceae bacterium]MCB9951447.1 cadherin domain-containing protein [Planctomycetaceae bacterium]